MIFMTSAKFSVFLIPSPVTVPNQLILFLSSAFWGPLPHPMQTSYMEAPLPNHPYLQDPLYLDKCITCWEQEWEDCFEVQEFAAKEGFIFKAEDMVRTRQWFR